MIFHYFAAGTIVAALVWHFAAGGRSRALRGLAVDRRIGRNSLSDDGHYAVWFAVIAFSVTSALLLLLPPVPMWVEMVIGAVFIAVSLLDFAIKRGRELGGYFTALVGTLIIVGNLT